MPLRADRTISGIGFQPVIDNGDRLEAYPTSNPATDCSVGPNEHRSLDATLHGGEPLPSGRFVGQITSTPGGHVMLAYKSRTTRWLQLIGVRRRDQLNRRQSTWLGASLMVVGFYSLVLAILMYFFSPTDTGAVFVYFGMGVIMAGMQIVAIMALIAALPPIVRLVFGFVCLAGIAGMIFASSHFVNWYGGRTDPIPEADLWSVPIGAIALQSGFWLLAILGWRIDRRGRPSRPLAIKHMLIITAVCAFVFAYANFLVLKFESLTLAAVFISAASVAGVALVGFVVPMLLLNRFRAVAGVLAIVGIATTIDIVVITLVDHYVSIISWSDAIGLSLVVAGYFAVSIWFVISLRSQGYRLYRRGRCLDSTQAAKAPVPKQISNPNVVDLVKDP